MLRLCIVGITHRRERLRTLTASTEKCSNDCEEICDGGVVAKEDSIPTSFVDQNDGEVEVDLVDIDLTPVKRAEITARTMLQLPLKSEATTYGTPPSASEGGCSPGCHALYDVACELELLPDTDEKQRQQSTSDDLFCKLKASETIAAAKANETIAAAKANTPKMQTILDEIVELYQR